MIKPNFLTLGCKLNSYETETIEDLCHQERVENITVINTCAVTAEAVRKAKKTIRRSRRENPSKKIVVTGCAAQIEPKTFSAMKEVDFIIGNQEKLSSSIWKSIKTRSNDQGSIPLVDVKDIFRISKLKPRKITKLSERSRAYVQIQNGCDHRCTFCIIPYGRGNSRSVSMEDVISQVHILIENGFKEIVLTGVDLTSWGKDLPKRPKLGFLVENILSSVPKLFRLRLSSIDSIEVDEQLIEIISYEKRFMPHLHLSLQSGDNLILKRMKRRHSRDQAIAFCRTIQEKRPTVTFGADLIVGFPTETEKMFQNTLDLIRECNLTWLHIFPFSARAGTPAAKMPAVNGNDIKKRAQALKSLGRKRVEQYLDSTVGKEQVILIEGNGKGRTESFAEAIVDPKLPAGLIKNFIPRNHDGLKLLCD